MASTVNEQEITMGEKCTVLIFLFITAALMMVEIGLMDLSLLKVPFLIQSIYDKVTLPASLHFVTRFKWLFALVMYLVSCVPAVLLMGITGIGLSKIVKKD